MNGIISKLVLAVALVCASALAARSQEVGGCSSASLMGHYGFVVTGTIIGVGPIAVVGVATYDGEGNWSRHETAVVNGHVLLPETIAGNYIMNSDCTGSTTDAQGHHSNFVLLKHGEEILTIGTDNGSVTTATAKRQ